MTLRLELITETDKARLYQFKDGCQIWIPRSVCKSTVKFPNDDPLANPIHEVVIEDWWWQKQEDDYDVDRRESL